MVPWCAACTVGPDYHGPPTVVAADRSFSRATAAGTSTAPIRAADWWTALRDPALDRLEAMALRNSPDLDKARARLRESRAELQGKQADLRPSTGTSALYLHTHGGSGVLDGLASSETTAEEEEAAAAGSSGTTSTSSSDDYNFYDLGFDASWEIDLFGGRRRAAEKAARTADARRADMADAAVSLTAEVADAYVMLRDIQHRMTLLGRSAALQEQAMQLTERRLAGGTASAIDVERLNGQVAQTRADLVPLGAQRDEQLDRLAVLTGQLPGTLDDALAGDPGVPLPPETVTVGDPAALVRRRPDIRAAERQIAASNAAIGQNVAKYFPTLQLYGNLGFASTDVGSLLEGGSFSTVAAPLLSWKPFDFGRTAAAVRQARAGRDEAVAQYRGTVLKALGDAETAVSRYGNQKQDVAALFRTMSSAEHAAALMQARFEGGTASLIDVLDTERQQVRSEQAYAQAQAELTRDFVALQKSLGLGWQQDATDNAAG